MESLPFMELGVCRVIGPWEIFSFASACINTFHTTYGIRHKKIIHTISTIGGILFIVIFIPALWKPSCVNGWPRISVFSDQVSRVLCALYLSQSSRLIAVTYCTVRANHKVRVISYSTYLRVVVIISTPRDVYPSNYWSNYWTTLVRMWCGLAQSSM